MVDSRSNLFTSQEWAALVRALGLTQRQSEVVNSVICGLSDKQIADAMKVKPPTVRTHLQRVYAKLGVRDRTELVVHCFSVFRKDVSSD